MSGFEVSCFMARLHGRVGNGLLERHVVLIMLFAGPYPMVTLRRLQAELLVIAGWGSD